MIERIHIKNYRGIKELRIDDLKPINIFVGKNAAGKTSVLEAFALAANPTLAEHFKLSSLRGLQVPEFNEAHTLDTIFNLHEPDVPAHINFTYSSPEKFRTTSQTDEMGQNFSEGLYSQSDLVDAAVNNDYALEIRPLYAEDLDDRKIKSLSEPRASYGIILNRIVGIHQTLSFDDNVQIDQRIVPSDDGYELLGNKNEVKKLGNFFIEARQSMSIKETAQLLGAKFLTVAWRESFLAQVRSVRPDIRDIQVINNAIYADIGAEQLLPIPMLGDGFNRLFLILVGLMASNQKTIMVDEIDSGLHHSIMDDFWGVIGEITKQEIQLFCTTHNEEMIDSLLGAFGADSDIFQIYRINRNEENETSCTVYSPERFEKALDFGFDVR